MSLSKQLIILQKKDAVQIGNKYVFSFPKGITFTSWRVKTIKSDEDQLPNEYYFDSSYVGTSEGSQLKPYTSISSFVSKILNTTPRKIKVVMNGEFTISDTITINHINWDIRILGNSNTIIKYTDISKDLIVVTSCRRFEIRDLELNTCRYGLRTYASTEEIIVHNIIFKKCGSSGNFANHDTANALSQATLASKFAAGTELISGGACRVKTNTGKQIIVSNCHIEFCLRAIRVENAFYGSKVINNYITYGSDNGIYCRNCVGVYVGNNRVFNMGHIGLQTIYCADTTFISNDINVTWGCGFVDYGSVNTCLIGNNFTHCNILSYSGYGANSDHEGQYSFLANRVANAHQFIAKIINNNHTQSKTLNSVILHFANILSSYSGHPLYFEDNAYEDSMTQTLNGFTITNLNQQSTNISGNSVEELNDVSSAGSGAIITSAERGIQALNTVAAAVNSTAIATKENTLTWSTVADNHATNPVTSANIKTYVDSAGGSTPLLIVEDNQFTWYQIPADFDNGLVYWSRNTAGNQGGSQGLFYLPGAPTNKMSFRVWGGNAVDNSGTITLRIANSTGTGIVFHQSGDDQQDITFSGAAGYKNVNLANCGRNQYEVFYYDSLTGTPQKQWYVTRISTQITEAEITQITTNETNIDNQLHTIMINNTDSTYAYTNNPIVHLNLPNNKKNIRLVYGDGTDFSASSHGLFFRFPTSPPDGCYIEVVNSIHKNVGGTDYTFAPLLTWDTYGSIPNSRRLSYCYNNTHWDYTANQSPTAKWVFYGSTQHTITGRCYYNASMDVWIVRFSRN